MSKFLRTKFLASLTDLETFVVYGLSSVGTITKQSDLNSDLRY